MDWSMMNLDLRKKGIRYFHIRWSKFRKKSYIPKLSHLKRNEGCAFFVPENL
jgi:hypothetical protein